MHRHGRLAPLETIDDQAYTRYDKRYAEKLSHIQDHIFLESHLRFLDEFDKKTHSEKDYEENADQGSSFKFRKTVFIQAHKHQSENKIAQCLIQLGRMTRSRKNRFGASFPSMQILDKPKSPRQIRRMSYRQAS